MSTPWGTSPYATPTPVIDSVTRNSAPATTPVPIPGLTPLPFPPLGFPQVPAPYMGGPSLGFPYSGFPQTGFPYSGFAPLPFPQYMAPQAPAPYMGFPYSGFAQMGFPQYMAPQTPAPYMGFPQYMAPQTPAPYMGMLSPAFHPAQAFGLDSQMALGPGVGFGGHAVHPIVTVLLSQLGLREAIARIGDESLKQRVTNSINEAIDRTIEGVSGMTLSPWFGPGAQFMIYPIASQLSLIAQRYPEGAVRDGLLTISGQILQKSIAPTGESGGRHR